MKPKQSDAECPITGQNQSVDIYSERTNAYYAKQIRAIRSEE